MFLKTFKFHQLNNVIKYGLYTAAGIGVLVLILKLYYFLTYSYPLPTQDFLRTILSFLGLILILLIYISSIIGVYLGIRSKKKLSGKISFWEGFKEGAAISLVAATISAPIFLLFNSLLNPYPISQAREVSIEEIAKQLANIDPEVFKILFLVTEAIGNAFTLALNGLISSAIVAAIFATKKLKTAR